MAFCVECGEQLIDGACPKCGQAIALVKSPNEKSKTTSILLALFLGSTGIHKFYLGEKKEGFLYLTLFIIGCITYIYLIWIAQILAMIDLVKFIMMSDNDFNNKYNSNIILSTTSSTSSTSSTNTEKKKSTAILFALFLGWIGIHKFYLGEKTYGILYVVFFWTLIPYILAIIDLVKLIMMSDVEFHAKYNYKAPV